ncbi:bile acid:sodium symporter family protein [Sphingomonas sp. Root710]|uniref:bile acid:sodium symporter family protein n=1 Tax=Sphingomonas sp. Root710 TaxID=1736594 RepID=UPI0012E3F8E2|nr:bile acid:sodium symporter family protein [Sphingomonas sp. Root710]
MMIATVAFAAVMPARGIGADITSFAVDAGIVFLFFLYGARISTADALIGMSHWRLQLAVAATTFVLFPVLGALISAASAGLIPKLLLTGLMFLCVLPSTVQSSIAFTSIARGNVPAALCAASASNIIGVVVTPLLAGWLLQAAGAQLSLGVFRDIVLQLLAPFVVGQLLRKWIGAWVTRNKKLLTIADRGSILLIIYAAFSRGMVSGVWSQIEPSDLAILLVVLGLLLSCVLLITKWASRSVFRFSAPDEVVLQFCGSTKSLASGLPIASVLFSGGGVGLIILPLMLFHQMQLIVCAILARHRGEQPQAALAEA